MFFTPIARRIWAPMPRSLESSWGSFRVFGRLHLGISVQFIRKSTSVAGFVQENNRTFSNALNVSECVVQFGTFAEVCDLENVCHHARGMHAHRHGFLCAPRAHHQSKVVHVVGGLPETDGLNAPKAVFNSTSQCVQSNSRAPSDTNEVCNGHELHVVLLGQFHQLGEPGHRPILIHDFHDHTCGLKACKPREVHSCFGVSRAPKDTSGLGAQRKDVSGPSQLAWLGVGTNQGLDGFGPVAGGDARGATMPHQIDGDRERRFEGRVVGLDHQAQLEFVASRLEKRGANEPSAVGGHEVDDFWRCVTRSNEKVPFVLTVLIVDDNDDFSLPNGLDGFRDGVQLRHVCQR